MLEISKILEVRKNNYGGFKANAELTQGIISICNKHTNYNNFEDVCIKETIHMIAHKIARIMCGDYFYKDSYIDIIGYAKICIDELDYNINSDNIITITDNRFLLEELSNGFLFEELCNDIKNIINKQYFRITSSDIFSKLYIILCILPHLINEDKEITTMLLKQIIQITENILKEHFNES